MALKDIFDMFSGTSTGSILAAGFAYPNDAPGKPEGEPKFFANDILAIYSDRGGEIFVPQKTRSLLLVLWIFIFLFICGGLGYMLGNYLYDSPKTKAALESLRITLEKKEGINHKKETTAISTGIWNRMFRKTDKTDIKIGSSLNKEGGF